ncbi:MAG: hypothetical protein VKJ24_10780 [Synechococcales bacterium]|nr:hypothetical protein [Synechococcales bacterium]
MLKRALLLAAATTLIGANGAIAGADAWEYQGVASTGEKVSLNLDSIEVVMRSLGMKRPPSYFFTYQIGAERVLAMTNCTGTFSPVSANGVTFDNWMRPTSKATRQMLDRVCSYPVKTVRVFSPPSNVRTIPEGDVLCTLRSQTKITTYGAYQQGDWLYTDACGRLGVIHSSQIR